MKKNTLALISTFCCLWLSVSLQAQTFEWFNLPVTVNGEVLLNPWAGGLNAPQWSAVDLNNDGKLDLYAFDRNGNKHLTFLNIGGAGETKYQFAPALAENFPTCKFIVLLRDYNQDGIMDLFASSFDEGVSGLKVYKGSFVGGQLVFDRVEFPWFFDVITVVIGAGVTNLSVEVLEYPAIADLDNDGDLDILTSSEGDHLVYYENQSVDLGLSLDSLIYELKDPCWGAVTLKDFYHSFVLSADSCLCPTMEGLASLGQHPFQNTLCTFDDDNDGDKEILLGNLLYPTIIYGKNGGTPEEACIESQDTTFPKYNWPVEIPFPASFYLDFDNDGIKDMVVSPNLPYGSIDREVVWFYRNTQTNEFPHFALQQKDILVDGMIDMGTGANPAFFDYNADGLMDMVVGNERLWKSDFEYDAGLWLFKNIGTATMPAFELVDTNWLDFHQFTLDPNNPTYGFAPTFGDLDSDGDLDLLVGDRYGTLFFVENQAGPGEPALFGQKQPFWQNIKVGQFSTPALHDMNGDGLQDLIIGEYTGNVNYLPNLGTPSNPVFHPNPNEAPNNFYFGKIITQQPGYSSGYSAPAIIACGDSTIIVTGSENGFLKKYLVNPDSLNSGSFTLLDEAIDSLYLGWKTHPAFADLNGDGSLEAAIGNNRGGLGLFATDFGMGCLVATKERHVSFEVKIMPNPASDFLTILLPEPNFSRLEVQIFDAQGRLVEQQSFVDGQSLRVAELPSGFYAVKVTDGKQVFIGKFIKQ